MVGHFHRNHVLPRDAAFTTSTSTSPAPLLCTTWTTVSRRPQDARRRYIAAMDRYISRKRPHSPPAEPQVAVSADDDDDDASTDIKLAQLESLFAEIPQETLLDILVSCSGCVETAISTITAQQRSPPPKRRLAGVGTSAAIQTSLTSHILRSHSTGEKKNRATANAATKYITQKGKTLHLFAPEDIAAHTPCTIIHNFLPTEQANALLLELLAESQHFSRYRFQLFDRIVQSPHSMCVYVSTPEEQSHHSPSTEYTYGGIYRSNTRQATPHLRGVSAQVQRAVNEQIHARIRDVYPHARKLKYQSPQEWVPNAAFVNCYDGPAESVGFHSDELTYLGPRPVIGSLSLGVQREFRVRRVVPEEGEVGDAVEEEEEEGNVDGGGKKTVSANNERAHAQGQISIALPHNSLLIMHAEMQEEWKHAIVPAQTISPHPLSGNRRINITYRWYRDSLHPRNTPRCRCGAHAILKCAQLKRDTRGRYMWTCFMGYVPNKKGCGFFQWAEFDEDGEPLWKHPQAQIKEDGDAPKLKNFAD